MAKYIAHIAFFCFVVMRKQYDALGSAIKFEWSLLIRVFVLVREGEGGKEWRKIVQCHFYFLPVKPPTGLFSPAFRISRSRMKPNKNIALQSATQSNCYRMAFSGVSVCLERRGSKFIVTISILSIFTPSGHTMF